MGRDTNCLNVVQEFWGLWSKHSLPSPDPGEFHSQTISGIESARPQRFSSMRRGEEDFTFRFAHYVSSLALSEDLLKGELQRYLGEVVSIHFIG